MIGMIGSFHGTEQVQLEPSTGDAWFLQKTSHLPYNIAVGILSLSLAKMRRPELACVV